MTLRECLGGDVRRVDAQVDALLDRENGMLRWPQLSARPLIKDVRRFTAVSTPWGCERAHG